jgi:glyoxylase-like metal-dependent hydrolase (beta-lactamase superfamily II)
MSRLLNTFEVGDLEVAALSDGAPDRAMKGFFSTPEASEWAKWLGLTDPDDPMPFNFGAFLVRGGGHTVLVDSGFGTPGRQMDVPGAGQIPQRLGDLGVGLDEVDTIVHTHLHPDHCGWDIDMDQSDERTFPNATVWVSHREVDYWTAPEQADDERAGTGRRVVARLTADDRLETFDGEYAVTPFLTMVPTPGHTPGHCSVLLASGGEHLLITGDAAHHPAQLVHHGVTPAVDVDPEASVRSRQKLAAMAADRDALVTGGHWPILTLGHVRRTDSGYRWEAKRSAY